MREGPRAQGNRSAIGVRKAGQEGGQRDERAEVRNRREQESPGGQRRGEARGGEGERALGFREYYLVSADNDTSASFYSPHQL